MSKKQQPYVMTKIPEPRILIVASEISQIQSRQSEILLRTAKLQLELDDLEQEIDEMDKTQTELVREMDRLSVTKAVAV